MSDCIFCKIISGEIPANKVYEDVNVCAFLDIQPVHPGHTLVVPKVHAPTLLDIPAEVLLKTVETLPHVARAVVKAAKAEGFNLTQNNGEVAGQSVHHLHFHIIPRHANDGLRPWPHTTYPSEAAATSLAEQIRQAMEG